MHDHTRMLAKGTSSADPYCDALRRGTQKKLIMTNEGDQQYVEESEVAQQPTYDNSYPAGLTVKLKRGS